jgi:hypothetical protein
LEALRHDCVDRLDLALLSWDPSLEELEPGVLSDAIKRLCSDDAEDGKKNKKFAGLSLRLSTSPSPFLMADGTVSLPLDWA